MTDEQAKRDGRDIIEEDILKGIFSPFFVKYTFNLIILGKMVIY